MEPYSIGNFYVSVYGLFIAIAYDSGWLIGIIGRSVSLSALIPVMAWGFGHYLNQCWFIINDIPWHNPQYDLMENAEWINQWYECADYKFPFTITFFRGSVGQICDNTSNTDGALLMTKMQDG